MSNKISELIKFYDSLNETIDRLSVEDIINDKIHCLNAIISNNNIDNFQEKLIDLTDRYKQITSETSSVIDNIKILLADIQAQIDIQAQDLMQAQGSNQIILPARNAELVESVQQAIRMCSNWHYPGLLLHPMDKSWIDTMVSSDPLYLYVDHTTPNDIINEYPEQYQRRLRLYQNIDILPQNQFGTIFVWEFFTHLHFNDVKLYLDKFLSLLRPGGSLIFNYHDCDIYTLAKIAEENHLHYNNKRLLIQTCIELGYNVVRTEIENHTDIIPLNWIQLTKPGELATVKRAQAMGAVLSK